MEVIIISVALGAAITHTIHLVKSHFFRRKMLMSHGIIQAKLGGAHPGTSGKLTLIPVADVPAGTTTEEMGLMFPGPDGMVGLDPSDTPGIATEDIPKNTPCVWDLERGTITPTHRGDDE